MFGFVRHHLSDPFVLFVAATALLAGLMIAGAASTGAESRPSRLAVKPPETTSNVTVLASAADTNDAPPVQAASSEPTYEFAWPGEGRISQGMTAGHRGLDIVADAGDPIRAVRAGRVVAAGGDPCCVYGHHVIVEHDEGWSSLYAHLSTVAVSASDLVEQGQILGLAGDSGKADGVHLHFELLRSGAPVDPLSYLEPRRYYVPAVDYVSIAADPAPEEDEEQPPSSADRAIASAVSWMRFQGDSGYWVDRASCFAIPNGPNWSVSCSATDPGCEGSSCTAHLEACVIEPQLLVEATCSGY